MMNRMTSRNDYDQFKVKMLQHFGFTFPDIFLHKAHVYGYFIDKKLVAGFILNPYRNNLKNFRIFKQVENKHYILILDKLLSDKNICRSCSKDLWEFTAYFISDELKSNKIKSIIFTLKMIFIAILKGKFFFYAFDKRNLKLAEYYGLGNPHLLYIGTVNYSVENQNKEIENRVGDEQIEYLDRMGLIKIFMKRTIKEIRTWLRIL